MPDLTDGQLVGRFVRSRDGDAFAALVCRHGPMVLAVCRRVAGDTHLADDAFQAAFLVLARRAANVSPREAVRAWLYGVAVRTAREARSMSARRRSREVPVAAVPDRAASAESPTDADALWALDEEVARLPDHLRAAVVLCELDGLSRKEAADRLGVPEGTLSSRLAKARRLLAERLRGRGVVVSAAGLAVLFDRSTAVALPADLADAAAGLASLGPVAMTVSELSRGVFRTMLLKKLKVASAGVVLLLTGAAGVFAWDGSAGAGDEERRTEPVRAVRRAPVPAAPREGVILVSTLRGDKPAELFKPDGTPIRVPKVGGAGQPWYVRLSPDGKRAVAFVERPPAPGPKPITWQRQDLFVLDLDADEGPAEPVLRDLYMGRACWSPDGTKLYGNEIDPEKVADELKEGQRFPTASWVYDLKTKTKTRLALPAGHGVVDVSPDGKSLLTVTHDVGVRRRQTYLAPLDTLEPTPIGKDDFIGIRFSPDGKRVLGNRHSGWSPPQGAAPGGPAGWTVRVETQGLVILSLTDKTETPVRLVEGASTVYGACWSPDGKRILYHWYEEIPQPPGTPPPAGPGPHRWQASRVTVADPDGSNAKTIIRREYNQTITGIDWR
ncbi:MAG TPA: sigma-70 family RNA polymerase sigma factor [Fimbriiglobus sp.]|jgi:RNA polymerase sigma factor (sigma-70 family)|nr:sigma-70 family RNA polymerase sigma factor [Fimbriiglobus sp.]